jgi:hypothetical protein
MAFKTELIGKQIGNHECTSENKPCMSSNLSLKDLDSAIDQVNACSQIGSAKPNINQDKALAEAHWAWLETLLHKVYVDAMIHGIKHGKEDDWNQLTK